METQKIVNLLNGSSNKNSKFTKKNGVLIIVKRMVITYLIMKLNFKEVH